MGGTGEGIVYSLASVIFFCPKPYSLINKGDFIDQFIFKETLKGIKQSILT